MKRIIENSVFFKTGSNLSWFHSFMGIKKQLWHALSVNGVRIMSQFGTHFHTVVLRWAKRDSHYRRHDELDWLIWVTLLIIYKTLSRDNWRYYCLFLHFKLCIVSRRSRGGSHSTLLSYSKAEKESFSRREEMKQTEETIKQTTLHCCLWSQLSAESSWFYKLLVLSSPIQRSSTIRKCNISENVEE